MSGIKSLSYKGISQPHGVLNPTKKASNSSSAYISYARRYLDWNRLTFEYHAVGSQEGTFDLHSGERVTGDITALRAQLGTSKLFGCAPQTWCESCGPFGSPGTIFSLVPTAIAATVVNTTRATIPRLIIGNTGSIRFDLFKGPFTYDDSFIVSPFTDGFQYIPNVPYSQASKVLNAINKVPGDKKRDMDSKFGSIPLLDHDSCVDPTLGAVSTSTDLKSRGIKRTTQIITAGYTTTDDFGTDGDDTPHSPIPNYSQPTYFQAQGGFPTDNSTPTTVDLIFLDFIASDILSVLTSLGAKYTTADVSYYLPPTGPNAFTTRDYLPAYAKLAWQAGVPNCSVS